MSIIQKAKIKQSKKLMDDLKKKFPKIEPESSEPDAQPRSAADQIMEGIESGGLDTSEAEAERLRQIGLRIQENQALKKAAENKLN